MAAAEEAKATRTHYANTAENIIEEGLQALNVRLPDEAWDAGLAAYYCAVSAAAKPVEGDPQAGAAQADRTGPRSGPGVKHILVAGHDDADLARFGMLNYLPVRVYSSVFGMVKPHPTIYRQALDRLDVAPAEAVFVGDKLAVDIAGPQKIGMRAGSDRVPLPCGGDPRSFQTCASKPLMIWRTCSRPGTESWRCPYTDSSSVLCLSAPTF